MKMTLTVALLAACNGDKATPNTGDTGTGGTTTSDFQQVMRDCPTDVGNICPWVGAGYGGWNGDGVDVLDAWMSFPMSVSFPPAGTQGPPIIADWNNHKLRAVQDGKLVTVMGTDFLGDGDPLLADRTPAGALGTDVALNHPTMGQYYSDGLYLSDSWHTHKFRYMNLETGMVNVAFGSRPGFAIDADADSTTPAVNVEFDEPAAMTLMNQPKDLWIDRNDENVVYYVDMRNERIREWNKTTGLVNTIAGETVDSADVDTVPGSKGWCGTNDDEALATCFGFPKNANPEPGGAIAMTADGSIMYVADSENHVIRAIDMTATPRRITTLSGTGGTPGFKDGAADQALWDYPSDFALDEAAHALYVADTNNHRIRMIDLETLQVTTVAGTGTPSCDLAADELLIPKVCDGQHTGGDGGPATEATLYRPFGVDIDGDGNLVISDTYDHRIRVVYR